MFRSLGVGWLSETVLWEEKLYAHHGGARPSWEQRRIGSCPHAESESQMSFH